MKEGQNPEFLSHKYQDLPGSKPVERAVQGKLQRGEKVHTKDERVEAYLDRIESVTEDERGYRLLKRKIVKDFTLDTSDKSLMEETAQGLYESEKKIAIERGRSADIERLESSQNIVEKYKPLIEEKAEIQRKTLTGWLDGLQEHADENPMWFRYLAVRHLQKMGTLDKEKARYSRRSTKTIAPFPEFNFEAVGLTRRWLTKGVDPKDELVDSRQKEVEKALNKKDFSKLYAIAQIETAGRLNRETTEGEWKKYDQGSDYLKLEGDLKGKGTGWCTAEGSAEEQLKNGDFYVYYSFGKDGKPTEPRTAIRMEEGKVAEIRGVNTRQELEPELIDIAQEKYHDLPGGESFDKKSEDVGHLNEIYYKTFKIEKAEDGTEQKSLLNPDLSKDDLAFLYEIKQPIDSFGYDKHPRIKEILDARDTEADMPGALGCEPEQIARTVKEINDDTAAYVGPLETGIFNKLPDSVEYIYTSFPERLIRRQTIEIGGKTKDRLLQELKSKGMKVYKSAEKMMNRPEFVVSGEKEDADLVRLTVADMDIEGDATIEKVYKRAVELGLDLVPAEVGLRYRLQYEDQPASGFLYMGMEVIPGPDGDPSIFELNRYGGDLSIYDRWADPEQKFYSNNMFMFRLRQPSHEASADRQVT